MLKKEAITKLSDLIARSDALSSVISGERQTAVAQWRNEVQLALKHVFPPDSDYPARFRAISFVPVVDNGGPDIPERAIQAGLSAARSLLEACRLEVSEYWPDNIPIGQATRDESHAQEVFVIHGRQFLSDFHSFLRAMGLRPLEWNAARKLTKKPNPYTWEIVDTALRQAQAIVALLTPDDEARLRENLWEAVESNDEKQFSYQPRQNVLLEAGVAYGRRPEQTVLIRIGLQRPISDLAGHHIVQLTNSLESRIMVAEALQAAGCAVDRSGTDWLRLGDFDDHVDKRFR